jgi:hypothetical protein
VEKGLEPKLRNALKGPLKITGKGLRCTPPISLSFFISFCPFL